ncbi:MAG: hypothetical protein PWR03_127 [Tenuifilum sp.]|uniref:sugar transferase n=1 Tax=Tenuifilum sp. TaxID=2760880 RepID=UPI0024ABF16C|nr:sugar transferase [Tenuifilum sp.]MDI3525944.1 hypothetical protein [Tenuifilum sp.]
MNKRTIILIILDLLLILFSFWLATQLKNVSFKIYFINYLSGFIIFTTIWILASIINNKYNYSSYSLRHLSKNILISNLTALSVVTMLIFLTRNDYYSRFIVFATIAIVSLAELFIYNLWGLLKKTEVIPDDVLGKVERSLRRAMPVPVVSEEPIDPTRVKMVQKAILTEFSRDVYCFLEQNTNLFSEKTLIVSTTTRFNITNQPNNTYKTIINLKRVNDIRRINKFFEAVNEKIPVNGVFLCMAETQEERKARILRKFPPVLNYIYYFFDFILKRVFPKFPITKDIYFLLTRGENRVISRAELLGRLISCGFNIIEEQEIDHMQYVVAQKIRKPYFDMEPTYGPLIKLRRIGKGGKIIKVYKLRTMHPYSEYLQEYIYRKHDLQEGGKFKNDFRISTLGRFMRKLWIDELPMILNFLKGDLKIVGVRPLSKHYFSLYTKELQERRIKYKPGLIPPLYVDNPKTLEEIMESEIKYLNAYDKHPFFTDVKYFFVAVYNIIFKKYRSS